VVRPCAHLDLDAGDALPAARVQRSLRHERVLERERRACEALVDDQAAVRSELELAPGADAFRLEECALSFGQGLVDPSLQDEGGPIERHRGLLMVGQRLYPRHQYRRRRLQLDLQRAKTGGTAREQRVTSIRKASVPEITPR